MWPRLSFILSLSLLALRASCEHEVVIDKRSCKGPYSTIQNSITTVQRWANDAAEELRQKGNAMDPRIAEKVSWILGDDPTKLKAVEAGFVGIGKFLIVKADIYSEEWKSRQHATDIAVVCNGDYIQKRPSDDFPDYPYLDVLRNERLKETDEIVEMTQKKNREVEMAVHQWVGVHSSDRLTEFWSKADVLWINPDTIKEAKEGGDWRSFSQSKIQKAINPAMQKKMHDNLFNMPQKFRAIFGKDSMPTSPVDILGGFDLTILHELTHTAGAHHSSDEPENHCYGWRNVLECRNPKNADSIAYFALVVQLIKHHGYDVTKDGKVVKI